MFEKWIAPLLLKNKYLLLRILFSKRLIESAFRWFKLKILNAMLKIEYLKFTEGHTEKFNPVVCRFNVIKLSKWLSFPNMNSGTAVEIIGCNCLQLS